MKNDTPFKASRYARLLWNEWMMQPDDDCYNIGFVYEITGKLDVERLKTALQCYINRNPQIRSSFSEKQETLYQTFQSQIKDPIVCQDCSGQGQEELDGLIQKLCGQSFDLSHAPLFKFSILKADDHRHYLALRFHHIIVDGTSLEKIPLSIAALYNATDPLLPGEVVGEPPQLGAYLEYEEALFKKSSLPEALDYWEQLLGGRSLYVNLSKKESAPKNPDFSVKIFNFDLDQKLTNLISNLARENSATVFHVMAALWSVFLKKYSGQESIAFVYPVGMRPGNMMDMDGYAVNSLPMVTDYRENTTFVSLVGQIKEQRKLAKRHQFAPFDEIVNRYNKTAPSKYGQQYNNYLNAVISQSNELLDSPMDLKGVQVKAIPSSTLFHAEMGLIYRKEPQTLHCQICYNQALFEDFVYASAEKDFTRLAERLLADPHQEVDAVSLLAEGDRQQILCDWNKTDVPFSKEKTISALFEEQVEQTPDNLAVVYEGKSLSYRALNQQANQLAHAIRGKYREFHGKEIQGDTLIGFYMERGMEMIAGILAILKAGGAYVPFDLADPEERLKFKLDDSNCKMIVASAETLEKLQPLTGAKIPTISIDAEAREIEKRPASNPAPVNHSRNLACLIYTSGSTGRPKGVMTEHCGVVNFIDYHRKNFVPLKKHHHVLQSISLSFDASWTELALGLFTGSTLHIVKSMAEMTEKRMLQFLKDHEINVFISTPAMVENLSKKDSASLEIIICGGEVCEKSIMDDWSDRVKFYNAYGPTEATICATYSAHRRSKSNRNIGKPLQNKKAYILDARLNPVPKGLWGELYIGGEGLARGYWNRPELTRERFMDDPFAPAAGSKMYKTGDMVRWLEDGSIEFQERNDDQIKINGFRVELGEIENKLAQCPALSRNVVVCRERAGRKYLAAYYTTRDKIEPDALKKHLAGLLPNYMVPGCFLELPRLPLTPNGKIDKKALPDPHFEPAKETYAPPENAIQRQLCQTMKEVLGLDKIGIRDDFFANGGDSIACLRLSAKCRDKGHALSPRDIFEKRTAENLSRLIQENKGKGAAPDDQEDFSQTCRDFLPAGLLAEIHRRYAVEEILPANSLQQGFLYHLLSHPGDDAYHIQMLADYRQGIDVTKYEQAWKYAVKKYPPMRTCFNWKEEIVQIICRDIDFKLNFSDVSNHENKEAAIDEIRHADRKKGFDLAQPGLFRIYLVKQGESHYTLLKSEHHSITDGWSNSLQLNYVHAVYKQLLKNQSPPNEPDEAYCAAQKHLFVNQDKAQAYWNDRIKKAAPAHDIRPLFSANQNPDAMKKIREPREYSLRIDGAPYDLIKKAGLKAGATLNVLIQFAWHKLLSLYGGNSPTVAGTVVSGRALPIKGIENSVGLYVNTLPLIVDWREKTVQEQLNQIHSAMMEMDEHSSMNIGQLHRGGHRLFHSLFVFENYPLPEEETPGPEALEFTLRKAAGKLDFPLCLAVFEKDHSLLLQLNYDGACLFPEDARKLMSQMELIINEIPDKLGVSHHAISALSPLDYEKTIHLWNKTALDYGRDQTIAEAFEAQAMKTPGQTALVFGGEKLTYRQLNQQANQIAAALKKDYLQNFGEAIKPGALVGLYLDRSVQMIAAILGILKAGAAYVPFDRADPAGRLQYKIEDCACKMMLTSSACAADLAFLPPGRPARWEIDRHTTEIAAQPDSNPNRINRATDLAYVIYTSGSTGQPKGVMLEHYGVINLAASHRQSFNIGEQSTILQFAPVSFDASVSTLFTTLLNGGTLCLCPEETRKDTQKLGELIVQNRVTLIDIPARLLEVFPRDLDLSHLRCIITAGEVCDQKTMDYWSGKVRLINAYGPTEGAVCATFSIHAKGKSNKNIGKPIGNKKVYVLNSDLTPLPVGAPGELYLGGDGLARGYLNRPEITRERFMANPFLKEGGPTLREARIYKTGDLVRWLDNGELEFLGRNDDQVKIHGYRIELGEIEQRLLSYPGISGGAAKIQDWKGAPCLCAYYSVSKKVLPEELKKHLSAALPDYMIPSHWMELPSLPLTVSGKIDRHALPVPELKTVDAPCIPPRNELEARLCELWRQILGLERLGIHDDFFNLGGNSIAAIKLVNKMTGLLGAEISIAELYQKRTIANFNFAEQPAQNKIEGEEIEL
ncbi:MAG: amino acid adenylation domain-containing protein [Verrucomicrobiae bacterium]|nr:amino acid adenylation domain-containing protein [Verrucomicrobiae bacterium]